MSDACCYCAERNQRRLAELRTLLAGIPGDSLTEQVGGLLQDRAMLDAIERDRLEVFDFDGQWCASVSHVENYWGPTLRAAIAAAMSSAAPATPPEKPL